MGSIGGIVQGIQGAIAYEDAKEEISKLPSYRDYSASPEARSYYGTLQDRVRNPYSAASNMGFKSLLNESSASAYQRAISVDPSLSGAVFAGMNTMGMQQQAQRAMAGDSLSAQYMGQLGRVVNMFQEIDNANVKGYNQRLHTKELSLEQLKQAARQTSEEGWVAWNDQSEEALGSMFSMMFAGGQGAGSMVKETERSSDTSKIGGGGGGAESSPSSSFKSGGGTGGSQYQGPAGDYNKPSNGGGGYGNWDNWSPVSTWMGGSGGGYG